MYEFTLEIYSVVVKPKITAIRINDFSYEKLYYIELS